MQHPFQCIVAVRPSSTSANDHLLAACGPKLLSLCLESGEIDSSWNASKSSGTASAAAPTDDDSARPTKKLKTTSTSLDAETVTNVINLTVSANNDYAVAVTDDKCIRVFSIKENGVLEELSSRCMPKRPCAIQVSPDNETIICGDKFGDVYSLPLLVAIELNGDSAEIELPVDIKQPKARQFQPSATDKTVHTQRNLRALAAQQTQQNLTAKSKEPLKFEHQLLLGHVSMLTDVTYTVQEVDGRRRGYLITADRDEHIRISRGPPQTHVIEGYCLGHKDFVNKICLIPGSDMLVSGGGDDWLGIWDWPHFKLLRKLPLGPMFGDGPLAVSGLWVAPQEAGHVLVVACEKSSRLAFVRTSWLLNDLDKEVLDDSMWFSAALDFPVLDVAFAGNNIFVSCDARESESPRIQAFSYHGAQSTRSSWLQDSGMEQKLQLMNSMENGSSDTAGLDNLLYGVQRLRKRGNWEETAEDA